jgi:hypothetical protein
MKIVERIRAAEERVDRLSLRERALLLLALIAVVFLVLDTWLIRPLDRQHERVTDELSQVRQRIDSLSASIEAVAGRERTDPDAALRVELEQLRQQVAQLERKLAGIDTGLLTPEQALEILSELLAERPSIRMVSLIKLPAEPLDPEVDRAGIFVQRFRVVIESSYQGVIEYASLIEELPRGLYWDSLQLDVSEWPTSRTEIVLYMLTFEEDWLGV